MRTRVSGWQHTIKMLVSHAAAIKLQPDFTAWLNVIIKPHSPKSPAITHSIWAADNTVLYALPLLLSLCLQSTYRQHLKLLADGRKVYKIGMPLTRCTRRGVLKSLPPWRRKPQGVERASRCRQTWISFGGPMGSVEGRQGADSQSAAIASNTDHNCRPPHSLLPPLTATRGATGTLLEQTWK